MLSVNEMVKVDESVIKKYHKKMINNLSKRGWALYQASSATVTNIDELEIIVSNGSEKESLTNDTLYQILPFVEEDNNWDKVRKTMEECIITRRYPFFVDISPDEIDEKGNESLKVKNVYLIDSIYFDEKENMFVLVPDYDLMFFLGIKSEKQGDILLSIPSAAEKVLRQMTKAKREDKSKYVEDLII